LCEEVRRTDSFKAKVIIVSGKIVVMQVEEWGEQYDSNAIMFEECSQLLTVTNEI
jgi:hypothetical protein